MPLQEDIGKAYKNYFTHASNKQSQETRLRDAYHFLRDCYLAQKYGYFGNSLASWRKLVGLLIYLLPVRKAILDGSVMYLSAQSEGRLLDVGCGNGQFLKWAKNLGWQGEGLDLDPVAVEAAKSNGCHAQLGTLESQHYRSDYFDVITMNHVIEHVPDPHLLLKESHRVLNSAGRIVLVTPNSRSMGHALFKANWRGLEPPRHLQIFNRQSARNLAEEGGFKVTLLLTTARSARSILIASRSLSRMRIEESNWVRTAPVHACGWGMQQAEHLLLQVGRDAGEEIVVVGEKA
jgi:2-polyprenyl-3-methyl-5-hydroxy-6-metoxy-1,4-benzoquinol methylase